MSRTENQKSKLLYLIKILWEETDEAHPMSASYMAKRLQQYGISCERKTIYVDLEELSEFGFDIIRGNQGAYLGSRFFEMPELKILIDAMQSSKFITEKKSQELIEKLSMFLSRYESDLLKRQVFVRDRVKTVNEGIYYNVDTINEGIEKDCKIEFIYYNWNVNKEMEPRRNGEKYVVSPWFLQYEDEKYYLVGYDEHAGKMKHYRVDKMKKVTLHKEPRQGRDSYEKISQGKYQQQFFHMFQGRKATVTLYCNEELASVVIDRFGKDVWLHPVESDRFSATVDIEVSDSFFGWLASLGTKIQIKEPLWVKEQYQNHLRQILGIK